MISPARGQPVDANTASLPTRMSSTVLSTAAGNRELGVGATARHAVDNAPSSAASPPKRIWRSVYRRA